MPVTKELLRKEFVDHEVFSVTSSSKIIISAIIPGYSVLSLQTCPKFSCERLSFGAVPVNIGCLVCP